MSGVDVLRTDDLTLKASLTEKVKDAELQQNIVQCLAAVEDGTCIIELRPTILNIACPTCLKV